MFILPVLALWLWNRHTYAVNSQAPDWSYIPGYNNFTEMWYWYFGTIEQREVNDIWVDLYGRLRYEILGLWGGLLFLLGIILAPKNRNYWLSIWFLAGAIIYLLIFFNLNVKHNYYQIPFILPFSVFIALAIDRIQDFIGSTPIKHAFAAILVGLFAYTSYTYSEENYFKETMDQTLLGKAINENSNPEDLVIVSYGGLSPQCPNIFAQGTALWVVYSNSTYQSAVGLPPLAGHKSSKNGDRVFR